LARLFKLQANRRPAPAIAVHLLGHFVELVIQERDDLVLTLAVPRPVRVPAQGAEHSM